MKPLWNFYGWIANFNPMDLPPSTNAWTSKDPSERFLIDGVSFQVGDKLSIVFSQEDIFMVTIEGRPVNFAGTKRYYLPLGWIELNSRKVETELFYGQGERELGDGKTLLRLYFFSSLVHGVRPEEYYLVTISKDTLTLSQIASDWLGPVISPFINHAVLK